MRVLLVKLTSLGDVIHTLPAVTDLARAYPDLELHWLVEESFASIPRWHPAVARVYSAGTRRWRRELRKFPGEFSALAGQLRSGVYDYIIDAQGLLKSALIARFARGERLGYDSASIKEPAASRLYNRRITVDKNQHAVLRTRQLFARALDYQPEELMDYGIFANQFAPIARLNPYLVFLHATTWTSKQWPVKYWQQLTDLAGVHQYEVMLPWGNEAEYSRALEIAQGRYHATVCQRMSLDEVAGMIAHARGVVAVDTGLGHLAAALAVPCVSLYGATDSRRTGTIGDRQKHLQAVFECSPCLSRECTFQGQTDVAPACFGQFAPQYVWRQLETTIYQE